MVNCLALNVILLLCDYVCVFHSEITDILHAVFVLFPNLQGAKIQKKAVPL